ncbi:MAG: hypothetical protein O2887_00400 [Bacteroidetes bacterium]|nr:hypothetical protein [Bacteroidota bacterium]MDA1118950.1 hypothetical protein [Bacteroidota bacterium]
MTFRFYHIINALSLDIALGAGILSLVLGRYLGLQIPVFVLLALVISVWIIYTADHLLDARTIPHQATSFRHHFHQHFRKEILIALFISFIGLFFILVQLPPITIFYGIPVVLGVSIYFILNRFFGLTFQKEILIAALYVIGVYIGPYSLSSGEIPKEMSLFLLQLGLMAWTNLLIFGIYEQGEDLQDGLKSMVTSWGVQKSGQLVKILLSTTFVLAIFGLLTFIEAINYFKLQMVFLFMNGVLGTLYFRRETLVQSGLQYRYFGDGIFFMPVAFFWF